MCNVITPMVRVHCTACDAPFMISKVLDDKLRQTGEEFWCPSKHSLSYRKSENKRLQERIAQLEQQLANETKSKQYWIEAEQRRCVELNDANRRINALRGWITRLQLRSKATTTEA